MSTVERRGRDGHLSHEGVRGTSVAEAVEHLLRDASRSLNPVSKKDPARVGRITAAASAAVSSIASDIYDACEDLEEQHAAYCLVAAMLLQNVQSFAAELDEDGVRG